MPNGEPDTWNLQDRGHFNLAPTAPLRWYTEGMINLMLKLIESLGGAQGILVGAALAWLIIGQNSLKARAKEDRDAADKRAKEDRDAAEKRAKEDRDTFREILEAIERRAKEDREAARAENAKNAAEHAALSTAIHELKAEVGVLLDRSNRSGSGDAAD